MSPGDTTAAFSRRCRHCGSELAANSTFCSKCGATAESPGGGADQLRERLQQLFGPDLEFEREIGRGGMAAVYAAFDPALQRRVAVKVLLPEISNDRSMADRFLREARTVAALQHPHVVTVYAVRSGEAVHAIVMQFVEGRSLDAVLHERGQIPVHVAGMLLSQAASGLQHAHDRGVIHRDVKPANVLIDHDGRAIVSDFGIARRESGPRTTDTGLVVGTWAYMSPEQRSGDKMGPATDQYALGVMAFELLTGKLPFTGTASEVLRAHMHEPPPSLRAIRPEVSVAVEALVHRMMAKEPEKRWPSLKEGERVFRTLVPDEGKTTLQLASFSKVVKAGASSVVMAVTRPVPEAARAAPTERYEAGRAAVDAPMVSVQAAPKSRAALIIVAASVLVAGGLGLWAMQGGGATAAPNSLGGPAGSGVAGQPPAGSQSLPAAPATPPAGTNARPDAAANAAGRGASNTAPNTATNAAPIAGAAIIPAPLAGQRAQAAPPDAAPPVVPPSSQPAVEKAAPKIEPTPTPTPPSANAANAAAAPAASVADARRLGREFVTMLNQRRYRELAQLPAVGGDATLRGEVIKLTESAQDFAAGFDRVPSAPAPWTNGFETEFFVDLEWRGGRKSVRVRLYASHGESGWRTAGVAIDPPG